MIRIFEMGKIKDEEIFARSEPTSEVEAIVRDIISDVRSRGDAALHDRKARARELGSHVNVQP